MAPQYLKWNQYVFGAGGIEEKRKEKKRVYAETKVGAGITKHV